MLNPFSSPITIIGKTIGRNPGAQFGVHRSDRLFHSFILGQTGTGKSTLVSNLIKQDIANGEGLCLLDPHGDLSEGLKAALPADAIHWNIGDPDCPFGYNPLSYVVEEYRPLVASGIIDALKSQWADAWGVRMEHLLRFAVLALLSRPGSSLQDIIPMYTDKAFRRKVLQSVTDAAVLDFWTKEVPKMNYKTAFDGVAPIANKLGAFLSHPVVRRALCDPKQPIRFRKVMDEGRVLVVNLSKGRLGRDISGVLGGLILSMIANAAMTREETQEHRRRPFFVYVDEFASFTTETTAHMLSELRKYRVSLTLAGQYLSGVNTSITDAILGNVGTIISFRIGVQDAPIMARTLGLDDASILITQPNYRMAIGLMIDGVRSRVFSARTIYNLAALGVGHVPTAEHRKPLQNNVIKVTKKRLKTNKASAKCR